MRASLGARIAVGTVLATTLVVSIAALATWFAARRMLYDSIDAKLRDRAAGFATRGVPLSLLALQQREGPPADPSVATTRTLVQVVDLATRRELTRSASLAPGVSLVELLPPGDAGLAVHETQLPDGRALRLLALKAQARAEDGAAAPPAALLVALALDASAAADELRRLGWTLAGLVGGAVVLAVAISAALRRAILRPVARLSEGIGAMDPSNLAARIALERAPRELATVLSRLNELLGKVEQSVRRERTTLADIAHELRTPVAGLMTTLEFAIADEASPRAREVHARCLAAAEQMRDLIANLLALARLEAGQEAWTPQPCDAVALLRERWDLVRPESERRGQLAAWITPSDAPLASSPDKLRVILGNLLGNAVDHAPDGVTIAIEVHRDPDRGRLRLRIANPMRIAVSDVAAVFRPFWRGDTSRTGAHAGLGLPLAQRLTRLLGGTLTAAVAGNEFAVTLELPAGD